MRICSIRGNNLASLAEEFVVDFEQAPLSNAGLFGITGPTGAGKSTLLDAMFLALFDATPRLPLTGGPAIGLGSEDEKHRIKANDVRSLLRKGAAEGSAAVEFIGRDGRRYRATWTVRRARKKPDGALQNQEMELRDVADDKVFGEKKTDTLREIELRLGLNFEQFRRSVVLAQGEFAAFLRAKEDDRAGLLEQMTGSCLYTDVSIKAFERAKAEEETLAKLQSERAATPPLPEDQRLALNQQVQQLAIELESSRTRLDNAVKAVAWFAMFANLVSEETTAKQTLTLAAKALNDAAPRREALTRLRTANEVRAQHEAASQATTRAQQATQAIAPVVAAFEQASTELEEAKQHQVSALEARKQAEQVLETTQEPLKAARVLDTQITAKTKEHTDVSAAAAQGKQEANQAIAAHTDVEKRTLALQEKRKSIEADLQRLAPFDALVSAWPTTRGILLTARTKLSGVELDPHWLGLSSSDALAEAHRRRGVAQQAETKAKHADVEAMAALNTTDRDSLLVEARALEARGPKLATLTGVHDDWRTASKKLRDTLTEAAAHLQQSEQASASAGVASQEQTSTRAKLENIESIEREFKKAAGLSAHRAELRDGSPCPLCGAKEHPAANEPSVIEARLEELTTEVAQYKASLERLGVDQNRHLLAANTAKSAAALRTHAAEEARATAGRLESRWTAEASTLDNAAPLVAANDLVIGWLSQQHQVLKAARTQLEQRQDTITAVEATARSSAKALEAHRELLGIADRSYQLEEALDSVSASLERLEGWRRRFLTGPVEFFADVDADVEARRKAEVAQRLLATDEATTLQRQRDAAKEVERLAAAVKHQAARVETCSNEFAALKVERTRFLYGRGADEVEQALKRDLDTHLEASDVAEQTRRHRETARTEADARLRGVKQQATLFGEEVERALTTLEAAAVSRGLSVEELPSLLASSAESLRQEEAALQQLEHTRRDHATRVVDREQKRSAHEASPRPDTAEDFAQAEVASLTDAKDDQQNQLGALGLQQKQDDERRARDATASKAIALQEVRATTWGRLRDVIGSADGKKFRKFAQSLTFEALLEQTNVHLKDLARRYELMRVPDHDLELQLIDHDLADEVRSVASLSGGESFLVSLALALGLSSLGAAGVRLDSLFIDEGFGTLDAETLDVALDVLDALQATGRKVGIISHVPGLESRLGAQIRITRTGSGRSRVEVGH